MAGRLRILWTFLLTLLSAAAWTEASLLGSGALIHAQWHFVWAWALTAALWCWRGVRAAQIGCAVAFVAHFALYTQPYWDEPAQLDGPTRSVQALWINAWGRPDVTEAARLLAQQHQVQLLAICQAGGAPALRRLAADFPYHAYDHEDRIGLFSSMPIVREEWIEGEPGHQPRVRKWLRADLEGDLRAWVGHVQQPHESANLPGMKVLYAAGQEEGAAILFADLNTTPWSADYQRGLAAGWTSARAGHWPTRTWRDPSQPWLRWPIDHVLVQGEVGVEDFRVLPSIGSDHLPLLVELALPEQD